MYVETKKKVTSKFTSPYRIINYVNLDLISNPFWTFPYNTKSILLIDRQRKR